VGQKNGRDGKFYAKPPVQLNVDGIQAHVLLGLKQPIAPRKAADNSEWGEKLLCFVCFLLFNTKK
jgi:hypothetical protein